MAINLDHVTEQITVTDTATNASLTVQPKGTGAFNIAAGSSGLNLSNGGTVTAVTKVADGANYTTLPTVAIAAPTTAGGVQAVLQLYMYQVPNTVAFGGTGYTVGNTLTVVGGTPVSSPTVLTVTSVSSGVITGVARTDFNAYTALPTNPVSVTGGSGSGATFNLVWGVGSIIITNAGSGYVEQPSITFSGGGGSGAAAYAGVGGIATIKALASNVASLQFATPGGVAFSVADTNRATVDYWEVIGSTGAVGLRVAGATGNNNGIITSKGSGYLSLQTNGFNSEALRATYTASSVNYVNATGAATGSGPTISAQGSDTNADLNFTTKGTGAVYLKSGNGTLAKFVDLGATITAYPSFSGSQYDRAYIGAEGTATNITIQYTTKGSASHIFATTASGLTQLAVGHTASAVNYVNITGAATTGAPTISAQGSDTNIGLNLSTKGTGGFVFASSGNSIFSGNGGTHFRVRTDIASATGFWEVFGSTAGPIFRSTATTGQIQTSGGQLSVQTDNAGTTQLTVAHTASAVNYVQVTGAATGGSPTISSQGSDASPDLTYNAKGTGRHFFQTGGSFTFQINAGSGQINRLRVQSSPTNFGPILDAVGSDTNIPLVLQPKGTGALQAQQTDSTATGGNARGAYAIDFQTARGTAAQVANGTLAVITGGQNNTSSGLLTTVSGGFNNTSSGNSAFVGGGQYNVASELRSVAVGGGVNTSAGIYNFVGGGFTNSGTSGSAVTTQSATMNGTTAVTLSGSNANIKVGQYISGTSIAADTYVAAISGTSLTLSQAASGSSTSTLSFFTPHGVVVGGGNNQATGSYSFIGGGGDAGTAANRNVASGDWSFIGGGAQNNASGAYSSVLGGANCSSTSAFSVCLGGAGNSSSGFGSTNLGGNGNVANGTYSVASGFSSTNRSLSTFAYAAGTASRNGDAQTEIFVLRNSTTDATATVLTLGAGAASTNNQVIMPNNSAYFFTGEVIAGVTGGGNTKGWTIEGVIKRGANAASTALVGTPTVTSMYADVGAATWAIAVTADTTNGGLAVTFTGQLATTIRVVAQIRTTEMTF